MTMKIQIEPKQAITGILDVEGLGKLRLDFLVTHESDAFYIRCLDLGIMSSRETVEECKENVREAIVIYRGDLPEGQSIFRPAPPKSIGKSSMSFDMKKSSKRISNFCWKSLK